MNNKPRDLILKSNKVSVLYYFLIFLHRLCINYIYLKTCLHAVTFTNWCGKQKRFINNYFRYGIRGERSKIQISNKKKIRAF